MPCPRAVHLAGCVVVVATLALLAESASARDVPWPLPAFTAGVVKRSFRLALARLESPGCQAIFRDFTDREGRTLAANLERLGDSPGEHLRRLRWLNGLDHPRCQDPNVLLVTQVGGRDVYVCPRQFTALAEREPGKAAGLILHEQLHTLGLGEDPPTSEQISLQVWARCGR
ncbi:MAG TPA: hypothetical protein VEQ10_10330 [Vicinamibacteria bacterium]|nr:hypothetical protein [Vicinamibacteria bacterium]